MVDNTTSTADPGVVSLWGTPADLERSGVPRGDILFSGIAALPSKLAADEDLWQLTCTFPRNYIYRLVECRAWFFADDTATLLDRNNSLGPVAVVSDDGDNAWLFQMPNEVYRGQAGVSVSQFTFEGVDPSFFTGHVADSVISAPIRSALAAATLVLNWVDQTGDTSLAISARWRIRALIYDVAQDLLWPLHTPVPTISP